MAGGAVTFKDDVWRRIMRQVELANSRAHVRVGVLAEKGGDQPASKGSISMIELAAIHEFGSPAAGIPQRSFIRSTFVARFDEMKHLCERLATSFVQGNQSMERVLGQLGAWGSGAIKTTIRDKLTTGPESQANSATTIARKGSSTPLVDTGRLINAITWFVDLTGGKA